MRGPDPATKRVLRAADLGEAEHAEARHRAEGEQREREPRGELYLSEHAHADDRGGERIHDRDPGYDDGRGEAAAEALQQDVRDDPAGCDRSDPEQRGLAR